MKITTPHYCDSCEKRSYAEIAYEFDDVRKARARIEQLVTIEGWKHMENGEEQPAGLVKQCQSCSEKD